MPPALTFNNSVFYPKCNCGFGMILRVNNNLNGTNELTFIMETHCVLYVVGTECLYTVLFR
jgi:hypothetical protein